MATFIALQCFHCSTMQVKQQKKSSNKWTCVVCNQKQSVRKVFAQSAAAKDVRRFVQNFNMSRQSLDQQQHQQYCLFEELQTSDLKPTNKKRTDWTEYIDIEEDDGDTENLTQDVVTTTEMPQAVFKKPKLKHYSSDKHVTNNKLLKPQFPIRNKVEKRQGNDQFQANPHLKNGIEEVSSERAVDTARYRASKWDNFRAQIHNRVEAFVQQPRQTLNGALHDNGAPRLGKGPVSKWSNFITEEDDDNDYDLQIGTLSCVGEDKNNVLDSLLNDQKVEDDIHPDFL